MKEERELKIAVDCHPCVSPMSGKRGVGRFINDIFAAYSAAFSDRIDVLLPLNFPEECVEYRKKLASMGPMAADLRTSGYLLSEPDSGKLEACQARANAVIMAQAVDRLDADFLILSHAFEGWMGGGVAPPSELYRTLKTPYGVIAYDLIPLELPHLYLPDECSRSWYFKQCRLLKRASLVFCISEHTAASLQQHLDIPEERLIVIHGAASGAFYKLDASAVVASRSVLVGMGVSSPFLLCTGGDDPRKNLKVLVRAFSLIAAKSIAHLQLLIACKLSDATRHDLLDFACECGLGEGDVVLTGYITDECLNLLYNACEAFVFPSLAEGLGFPVLEAMAAGACVLGSNSSSIREILIDTDCLFDPKSPDDIAEKVLALTGSPQNKNRVKEWLSKRSAAFTWERSVGLVREAVVSQVRRERVHSKLKNSPQKPRLAFFSPVPPQGSGIAAYSADLLPELAKFFEITVVHDDSATVGGDFLLSADTVPAAQFSGACFDYIVYQFGNSHYHRYMLPFIKENPGVIVMHDTYIHGFWSWLEGQPGYAGGFNRNFYYSHQPSDYVDGAQKPMGRALLECSVGVVVLSEADMVETRDAYPLLEPSVRVVESVCVAPERLPTHDERLSARERLGLDAGVFVISVLGHVGPQKKYGFVLNGVAEFLKSPSRPVRLFIVGPQGSEQYGNELRELCGSLGLDGVCKFAGQVSDADYSDYVAASDLGIALRETKTGLVSRALLCNLASGLPTIVNDAGFFSYLPDQVVLKFTTDDHSEFVSLLQKCVSGGVDLPAMRDFAHRYVRDHHSPQRVAEQYYQAILELSEDHAARSLGSAVAQIADSAVNSLGIGGQEGMERIASALACNRSMGNIRSRRRKLLIWIDHTCRYDGNSGIQRVCRSLLRGMESEGLSFHLVKWNGKRDGFVFCDASDLVQLRTHCGAQLPDQPTGGWDAANRQWYSPLFARSGGEIGYAELNGNVLLIPELQPGDEPQIGAIAEVAIRLGGRVGAIFYDAIIRCFPEAYNHVDIEWISSYMRHLADLDFVVSISHDALRDLEEYWGSLNKGFVRPRVDVVHLAGEFPGARRVDQVQFVQQGQVPLILCVGTIRPHKNQIRLIEAFKILRGLDQAPSAKLLLMGDVWAPMEKELSAAISGADAIEWIRCPTDEQILEAYERCAFTVFPSLKEGFGLPILESIWFGKPVICHNDSAMKEVAESGGGCLMVNTLDPVDLARAMRSLATDRSLYDKLAAQCIGRHMKTWAEYSAELLKVVQEATKV
jgi:glycosyltransferase involved in cell wall biosynthesis